MNTYIVAYDICDPRRLNRVYRLCRNYGDHLQKSVFECDLSKSEKAVFESQLSAVINNSEDQVIFVDLGPSSNRGQRAITSLGTPYVRVDSPCYVF